MQLTCYGNDEKSVLESMSTERAKEAELNVSTGGGGGSNGTKQEDYLQY